MAVPRNPAAFAQWKGGHKIEHLMKQARVTHPNERNLFNIAVGWFEDSKPYQRTESLGGIGSSDVSRTPGQVAQWMEFGAPNARIPARPFLGPALREYASFWGGRARWRKMNWKTGFRFTPEKEGFRMMQLIKQKIRDKKTPPNAPATILKKGYDRPLQETGRLQRSIKVKRVYGSLKNLKGGYLRL